MSPTANPHEGDVPAPALDRLLKIQDVSALLGVPVGTIYNWRYRGAGPRGIRIGRHVRFRRRDVEEWIDSRSEHAIAKSS